MSQFDKRIKVSTIIENQLPEFVSAGFPEAVEFFKTYYISQEFQGGPTDLISNFDQYIKPDNLVPEVVVGVTTTVGITTIGAKTINVPSTKGFPSEYGLLKIDDEIISYTGITSTSFTGCLRGFSGITGYNVGVSSSLIDVNRETLEFKETSAASHVSGATIQNLSVLFLQEFYKKLKKTFLPGFEDVTLADDLDVGNFVKFARSFYQSKGIEESIKILFKVLYGVQSKVLDLEKNIIKPSDAEFIRREVIIADLITSDGQPKNLVGQTIFKSDDLKTNASVSEVEIFTREEKSYYKISLFVGYSDRDLIQGIFKVNPNTKVLSDVNITDSIISVDSTVGFGTTGTIISGNNKISYESKSINQFFGCTGIGEPIKTADNIREDSNIFGYENGDLNKKIELRVTGVLSNLIVDDNKVNLVNEGETIFVKNIGEKISNDGLTNKEKFANIWIYNTSSRFQISNIQEEIGGGVGGTITLKTKIDKSSLKVGDKFQVVKRNGLEVDGEFNISSIISETQIATTNLGFTPVSGQEYDIRRVVNKASSSGTEIKEGNDEIISDVLNVYVDGDTDGYVASNSLPSFEITDEIIKETITGINLSSVDGQNPINGLYNFLKFDLNRDLKLIKGDAVVYNAIKDPNSANDDPVSAIPGLNDGNIYYVDPKFEGAGINVTKISLHTSRTQIGTASTVQIGIGASDKDQYTFTLLRHHNKKISANKILRKFPINQNLFASTNNDENITDIGILKNGVELRSPVSEDFINYGFLEDIELLNGGDDYDIINPPTIEIENEVGDEAKAEPILSGSVKQVFIDPQDFDISSVKNISLTGGNGDGCVLEAVMGDRFRELLFDSRPLALGGGVDITDETITFTEKHNLETGDSVFYLNNGNSSLPIGVAFDGTNTTTGTLASGDPYFVSVVNTSTIKLYNSQNDALSGINTVGLSTDTSVNGIHVIRTSSKKTIIDIKVINSGEGYQHRKLIVKPSGISTSYDTVNFNNHGFNHGDIINYSPMVGIGSTMPKAIQGLTTTSSYYVMKVDDNSFKLANAGVGGTSRLDFERGKFVGLNSTGTGYQTFKYPDIKVNLEVGYGGTVTGSFNITPVVRGSFTGAYLYESGSDFGSKILNNLSKPKISIKTGKFSEVTPVIANGKIVDVIVAEQGEGYTSLPDINVISSGVGAGAIVRPVIENGKVVDTVVINSGVGYDSSDTIADVVSSGINGAFDAKIRRLQINKQKRIGDSALISRTGFLSFNYIGCNQSLIKNLEKDTFTELENGDFDKINQHSSIIGWAYDGNPIYGPFGYSDPNNISSPLKIIESSYSKDKSKVINRPSEFEDGFFINDFIFDASGDLDIHNGRFCKTPEFPNGVYAYFATVEQNLNGKLVGAYPYFIGKTFRHPLIQENLILNQDFDFNNSNLIRNTFPYNVNEPFANNDFINESNEFIRQSSEVQSVTSGEVKSLNILNPGSGYKVGDLTSFDNTDTNGTGLKAEVSDIIGLGVSSIVTQLDRFEDLIFTWVDKDTVSAKYSPFIELNDKDYVFVSGLSTSINKLTDSFSIGISTSRVGLSKTMNVVSLGNVAIEDIFVNKLPENISPNSRIRVGSGNTSDTETLQVLNTFEDQRVIRVVRNTGIAHTFGSNIDLLNNLINIPVQTRKFESKVNDVIYFNAPQQIGIGTDGTGITSKYFVGETIKSITIQNRQIYLPNHPFTTGQKVILNVPNVPNKEIAVANTNNPDDLGGNFSIPFSGNSQELFVIKKSEDYIGLSTIKVGGTSEGLFFKSNASSVTGINTHLYNLTSQYEQVTGDIDKIVSTVTTKVSVANTTTHNLKNGDIVTINVVPNISVGINTTAPVQVHYNSEFEKLLVNTIKFTSSSVETNRIGIETHGFNTGDKVFYTGDGTAIPSGEYYISKINSKFFQLAETFNDLYANPIRLINITAGTGGNNQEISPINPQIKVYKNSKLTFGLSTTTLAGFDFKIFYDNGKNEYLSSQDSTSFNVIKKGIIGIGTDDSDPIGATVTLEHTDSSPSVLYYGLTKGGFISTADKDVQNYSQIIFVDSIYNGDYRISEVTPETFNFSPKLPEFLQYNEDDCEKIEYSTKSKNVIGGIKNLKILSNGFNYKKLPVFKKIISNEGQNANIVAQSNEIGRIKRVRVLDVGYEYSADKTLQPEVFIPSILNIDNLDTITGTNILNGGTDYTTPPNLILFNPSSNKIVDTVSLNALVPGQTISDVNIIAPIQGLDSTQHKIFAINNSNGIGINSIQTSSGGLVTCFLTTPMNGFPDPQPFQEGDEIFVEGIQRVGEGGFVGLGTGEEGSTGGGEVLGEGFNSQDHNFAFFKVTKYSNFASAELEFSVAGVTTNPGIAKTFQSGYANIINRKIYPDIVPIQERGKFQENEPLTLNNEKSELKIVELRDDFVKLDGFEIVKKGDRIIGESSGVSAEIVDLVDKSAKFEIGFSNRQEIGWLDNIGRLNDDTQVVPDNDYYQNLSYTVKSPITWDKFSNNVNSILHPAGLKNFADTFLESQVRVGLPTDSPTGKSKATLILDVLSEDNRVDAINNFDFVFDFNRLGNKTKTLLLQNKNLTNFNKCLTNRVLIHDDISPNFSSVGFAENTTLISEITGQVENYLIQIVDPDTFDTQLTELVILTTENDAILLEKSSDSCGVGLDSIDSNLKLGDFATEIQGDTKTLVFNPEEKFTRDHDIKVIKISRDSNISGITTTNIGSIKLISSNTGISSTFSGVNTTTIAEFNKDEFNGLHASVFVQDSITKEINYNEITVDFDGVNLTSSEIFIDDQSGSTTNTVGVLTTRLENDIVKLQIENDRVNILDSQSNIIGLGTTTVGIGTFRFLTSGQPIGAERSARYESTINQGTGTPITFATIDKTIDNSIKSIVRVSSGQTSAIHQVIALKDATDVLVVQYPFVSLGSTTGIGSFISETNGDNVSIRFVPDTEYSDEVNVQAYNQVFYTSSDFDNLPGTLKYGAVEQDIFLSTYDGLEGRRANKTKFDLKFEGTPIYSKTFDPDGVGLEKSTGIFTIPNHFYNTSEEITYTPKSTFIGVGATPVSIGSTVNSAGITTDILPSNVFVKVINENQFQLFPTKEDVTSGVAITITGVGEGNAHKLDFTNKLTKTVIGLDGIVQQPITFTSLSHTLDVSIGAATTQFSLSGIGSISTFDVLKINDEFMKIIEVGFSSTSDGSGEIDDQLNISLGISTIPTVRVDRGVLGIAATSHTNGDIVNIHRGSFNIVDSSVHFIAPPKGNTRSRRTVTELPFVKADFSGRTFLRQDYTTNMLFDDISDNFTGLTTAYTLKVGGANTSAGIELGNGVVFINGVFQTPFTSNNAGADNNYRILSDTVAGISTIRFTGITSENGQFIVADSDINQNQIPRGGLIVSLGSTPGLGYAPLVGAKVKVEKNSSGVLNNIVGIGTSSGFNIGIQTAVYDNITGIITVTTNDVHGFGFNSPNTVKLKGLEFKCPKTVVGQPTNANYTPSNGNLVITINNHGLVNGDAVVLETDSFVFTCTKDSNATNHSYPRATDPAANQYLTVSNVTTNTFRVNVGASAPGDVYPHTFVSATATAVQTIGGGGYVGVTTTIFQDHERPLFVVGIVSERSFEVQAGTSTIPHNYQGGGNVLEFFEDLTFGSGYRGGTVAIGVTDIEYEHKFVSSGIGSIRKNVYNGEAFTATDAIYESFSGLLTLTIPNHTFTTSDTVGIDTGGIVFKCSKDGFLGNHPYPRAVSKTSFPNSDPFAGSFVSIASTSPSEITFNVGAGGGGGTGAVVTATVGVGGTLSFDIVSGGTGYVNPQLMIPEPVYENLEVEGVSRLGVGATTDTGVNLLLNVGVSAANTSTGVGSTLFQIKDFEIARPGFSFKKGDKFKPVGLVTAAHLTSPLQEFELEVLEIFNDKFSAWQFGEIDAIDSIKILQDGVRTRFPLFFNGELLSFEKDLSDPRSLLINLDAVLLIFVNGVLQKPGEAYQFEGGTTFTFTEPPSGESGSGLNDNDKVDIFFYKGIDGTDVVIQNVPESLKVGDDLRVLENQELLGITTSQTTDRIIKEILNTDILDTDIYTGLGIDEINPKPIKWKKQKVDLTMNGQLISKSRSILEPQIYPTPKIIGDLSVTSGQGAGLQDGIFVDDARSFFYEEIRYGLDADEVDALITSGNVGVGAALTAIISSGSLVGFVTTNVGSGYEDGIIDISVTEPIGAGTTVGSASTATATATFSGGSLVSTNVTDAGSGFTHVPEAILPLPPFKTEKITKISKFQGFTGIITGITQVTRSGGLPALKFDFYAVNRNLDGSYDTASAQAVDLRVGYPILIKDTKVGNGCTSVNPVNANVVGIGTTFVDNVYIVNSVGTPNGARGSVTCNVHSNSAGSISGISTQGFFDGTQIGMTTSLGTLNWGRLYGVDVIRSSNPISIGVTGLVVDSGLSTFPTIQRKSYDGIGERGHRNSGSIRAILA